MVLAIFCWLNIFCKATQNSQDGFWNMVTGQPANDPSGLARNQLPAGQDGFATCLVSSLKDFLMGFGLWLLVDQLKKQIHISNQLVKLVFET